MLCIWILLCLFKNKSSASGSHTHADLTVSILVTTRKPHAQHSLQAAWTKLLAFSVFKTYLLQSLSWSQGQLSLLSKLGQEWATNGQWQCFLAGKVNDSLATHWSCVNKKLSYRWGTARCDMSVEILPIARNSAETTCMTSPEPSVSCR